MIVSDLDSLGPPIQIGIFVVEFVTQGLAGRNMTEKAEIAFSAAPSGLRMLGKTVLAGALLVAHGSVCAQTMSSNLSTFTHGYSAGAGEYAAPINPSTRDESGNQVIINGVMQTGSGASVFSQQSNAGVGTTSSGAMAGVNTAIGNNITVITQGNNNTVIVNATQTNNGAVTAGIVLNGQINLNNGG